MYCSSAVCLPARQTYATGVEGEGFCFFFSSQNSKLVIDFEIAFAVLKTLLSKYLWLLSVQIIEIIYIFSVSIG